MELSADRLVRPLSGIAADPRSRSAVWRLILSPSELVFALVLVFVLIGGRHALFNDPGTLWHLRLGRDILATGRVPHVDALTYTRANVPWVDQSWGFDLLLALVVDHAGWSAAVALTALLLATVYGGLAGGLVRNGTSSVVAVVIAILMAAVGCIHFLIRPHLFTLALVFLTLRVCQKQHERGGRTVAWVPLLTAILANLHGGFLALPAIVATAALAHTVSGPWDQARQRNVFAFVLAFLASCLAALLNPYGLDLYRHVGNLLVSSGVTSLISEYQPAPFGQPEARVLEMAVLALVGLPAVASRRIDRYQLVHLLVWLHLALTSIRYAPLFALVAAAPLAMLLDSLPLCFQTGWVEHERRTLWIPALAASLLLLVAAGLPLGGFDGQKWPFSALPTLNTQPPSSHLFHEQDWGGMVAAECRPVRSSYVDDRFELFGKEAILEYVDVLTGGPAWDKVRERDHIDLVWVKPDRGLARRLMEDPAWAVLYRDAVSVLLSKKPDGPLLTSSSTHPAP
jgi:hypothetical protein